MNRPARFAITDPLTAFGVTWFGQLISLLGSGLTSFAVGVEVYQRSGSITKFSLLSAVFYAPALLISPLAGAIVDRWNRRHVMLAADLGSGLSSCFIWALLAAGEKGLIAIQIWHLCVPFVMAAAFDAIRWPAYSAATTQLVPKQHLGRANGLVELANALVQVARPVLGGFLMTRIGLRGVVLIDLASFVCAVTSLCFVRFPPAPRADEGAAERPSLWQEAAAGVRHLRGDVGLVRLLAFGATANFVVNVVIVLITPLVLSFTDVPTLGAVLSVAGLGMLAGGVLMSVWGGPRRRIVGVFGFQTLGGCALLAAGLPPSTPLVMAGAAAFLFAYSPALGCLQSIWQSKVSPGLQGRVFALRRMVGQAMPPLAALVAGPLADKFFEPWMAPGGALADSVGRVLGTGPGRGIGLLFLVLAGVMFANIALAWSSPSVRNIETPEVA
jgi:MFS family permease